MEPKWKKTLKLIIEALLEVLGDLTSVMVSLFWLIVLIVLAVMLFKELGILTFQFGIN